jgi:CDP-paratose 2-epimerase
VPNVLITGSEGFVGSNAVRAFREAGWHVIGIDKTIGHRYDLSTGLLLVQLFVGLDVVVHLASSLSTPGSVLRPTETFRDTVMTTVNVLAMAREHKVPVIVTSSVKARDGRTPYGASKQMVESWSREFGLAYGLPVVIDRPGTIYGPGQEGSPESGWIAWFLKAKQEKLKITIDGDGLQLRDLLHVDDYCRLLLIQAEDISTFSGKTWDVGGGEKNVVSVLSMAQHLGLTYEFGPPRYGDAAVYIGENEVPGWEPLIQWRESGMFD